MLTVRTRSNSFSRRLLVLFCSTDRKGIHHLTLTAGVLVKVALEAIQDGTSAKGQYGHGTVLKRPSEDEDDISTRSVARKQLAIKAS